MNHQKETPPGKAALNDWPDNTGTRTRLCLGVKIGGAL